MIEKKEAFIILTPGFAASEDDSTCLPMQQQLVKMLASLKSRMSFIVLSFQYPYQTNEYKWNRNSVIPFNGRNKGGVQRLMLRKKVEAVLTDLKRQYRIRGLLSFWLGECALVGKRFGQENNIPHFCWLLGQDARKGNKYVKRVNAAGNELIALSDSISEEFFKNYGIRPLRVIQPGVDPLPFTTRDRDIDLIAVGSLIPLKRYEIFIDIVKALKEHSSSVKAVLIGEGSERKKLEGLIKNLDLESNIKLTGSIAHSEVLSIMQRSKILLHPSGYEGFSGVCMEALSCGAHVISFCQPMNHGIDHWHVVDSAILMKQKASDLLSRQLDHQPVIISDVKNTTQKIMELYGLQNA